MLAKSDTPLKETHRRTTEDGGLTELATKVADLFGMGVKEVIRRGKHRRRSEARSLLCFWAVDKLEMKQVDVAEALRMTTAGVGYAVSRGRSLAEERGYTLPGEGEESL
jgi:hypothetical protein